MPSGSPSFALFTLAGDSPEAMKLAAQRAQAELTSAGSLAELCARSHDAVGPCRLAVVADSLATLEAELAAYLSGGRLRSSYARNDIAPRKVAFLFTGQGSQYAGMGKALYASQPVFRAALETCHEILKPLLPTPLLDVLYGDGEVSALIDQTQYSQPALFAVEWALAEMWRSWGVVPAAVLGHSVGEYVAATVAGVMRLEDGLRLIATRGRLMQALPQDGDMLAVLAPEETLGDALTRFASKVSVAAYNGPTSVVVSGEREAIRAIEAELGEKNVRSQLLTVSHAFHSPLMDPMLDAFTSEAGRMTFAAPKIPLASNVTGRFLEEAPTADYWKKHVRGAVRFAQGMQTLAEDGELSFLEVGPNPVLVGMAQKFIPGDRTWLMSLRKGRDDWKHVTDGMAQLWTTGVAVTIS